MEVLTTKKFGNVELACYKPENESDDFLATREQIGQLLGYKEPMKSISNLHNRYKERLDKFSTIIKLMTVEGTRTVTRDVIVYNFKGLLEICRYSNQPKANEVIDFLWNIADEIRRTGSYGQSKAFEKLLEKYNQERQKNYELGQKLESVRASSNLGCVMIAQEGSISLFDAAHFLSQKGIEIGAIRLYKRCRELNLLCKRKGRQFNHLHSKQLQKDY